MKNKLITPLVIIFGLLVLIILVLPLFRKSDNKDIRKTFPLPTLISQNDGFKYSVWIPSWKEEQAIESLKNIKNGILTEANPVWYELDPNGRVVKSKVNDESVLKGVLKMKKIKLIPTVTNVTPNGFDHDRVSKLLQNQEVYIDEMVEVAVSNGYSGWDLDLEEIDKSDKDDYVDFTSKLLKKLHENNLTLSITVHAQSGKDVWKGTRGQDIKSLGENSDFLRVMAYDFHNSNSDSGAITPSSDLVETIKYTLENVELNKVAICLPTYGYDWSENEVIPLQFEDAKRLVEEEQIKVERDNESFELTGSYLKDGVKHVIWYQDSEATNEKLDLIKKFGITNFCFWHLGGEDEKMWNELVN